MSIYSFPRSVAFAFGVLFLMSSSGIATPTAGKSDNNSLIKWLQDRRVKIPDGGISEMKDLLLPKRGLTELPEFIGDLENLTILFLTCNSITSLPESIGNLINLQMLYAAENDLIDLPKSIGDLENLNTLFVPNNQLRMLPERIGDLQNLEALHLSQNQLSALPESIGELQNLTELTLSYNQLSALPESIANLQNLQRLEVDDGVEGMHHLLPLTKLTRLTVGNEKFETRAAVEGYLARFQGQVTKGAGTS